MPNKREEIIGLVRAILGLILHAIEMEWDEEVGRAREVEQSDRREYLEIEVGQAINDRYGPPEA